LILTDKGERVGKRLVYRHKLLEDFLRIIGVEEKNIYQDVEGIEHHMSWNSIDRIGNLVQYFQEDQDRKEALIKIQQQTKS
jgi:Mn-dependent DtxR family transcriptional regulator